MRTHYDNLHVKENASPEVIRAAYKALAQKYHPDKNPDQRDKAERIFKIISDAYSVLSDQAARAEYDFHISNVRAEIHASKNDTARASGDGGQGDNCSSASCASASEDVGGESVFEASSWHRFLARFLDSIVYIIFVYIAYVAIILFSESISYVSFLIFFGSIVAAFCVAEIAFMLVFSTTPGKHVLGLRVIDRAGGKIPFTAVVKRSFCVFLLGQCCFIPPLNVVANIFWQARIESGGDTVWDGIAETRVVGASVGWIRYAVFSFAVIALCLILVLLDVSFNNWLESGDLW